LLILSGQIAAMRKQRFGDALVANVRDAGGEAGWTEDRNAVVLGATPKAGAGYKFEFEQRGFIETVTTPMGRKWRQKVDGQGRILETVTPSESRISHQRDEHGRTTCLSRDGRAVCRFTYADLGWLSKATYPDGTTREIERNPTSELAGTKDRLGNREEFRYQDRRLVEIRNGKGIATTFDYDQSGRLARTRFPGGAAESYTWSGDGLLRTIQGPGGQVTEVSNGPAGRPVRVRYADGEELLFGYDRAGRITSAVNREATVRFEYDADGRVVRESTDTETIGYEYDADGNPVSLTYPSGARAGFTWDADFRLATVTDGNGGVHRFDYDADSRGYEHRLPNGIESKTTQLRTGLTESIRASLDGRPLFALDYRYDDEDRIRQFGDSSFAPRSYRYDAEGQLLGVTASSRTEEFRYDRAGNCVAMSGETAVYNDLDQLVSLDKAPYRYDERGNLVALSRKDGPVRLVYNSRNLLTAALLPDGSEVRFGYDALGRRVWKRSGGQETRYTWAGETMVSETVRKNGRTHIREFLYVPGTCRPLAMRVDGTVFCCHTDPLGTPRRMTDANGRVVWSAEFSAFGECRAEAAGEDMPLRFPGQYADGETGLYYNRFRYYSPKLGRYISKDPITFRAGLNFYRYCGNDPVNPADPLGLFGLKDAAVFGAGLVTAVAVGALVVATAPLSGPVLLGAAILAGGAAGGAVAGGLNQGLNEQHLCIPCVLKAMGRGLVSGLLAAIPFALLPLGASAIMLMGAGLASGEIGYVANWAITPGAKWSNDEFLKTALVSAVLAPVLAFAGGKLLGKPPEAARTKVYPDGSVRTPDGKFAGKTGVVPGTPGVTQAEAIINARPGWRVAGKEISVRDANGTLRRYDLVGQKPNGDYVGVEVKSGTATRTPQQRQVDANLEAQGGLDTVGQRAQDAGIDRISSVEVLNVP
jgi:RHS repeat-associated protein